MPYSIVIADDDRTICKGLSMIIEQKCPNLKLDGVFFNGDDLFSYLEKKNVDIILSDIVMQGKTGIDIAEHVKKISPNTFVVLITGHYVFDFAKRAIDSKVDYFITKPYTTDYLLEKLDEICKRMNLSRSHVQHLYKAFFGTSVTADIQSSRVEHAKYLLSATNMTVCGIALSCGYNNDTHFMRIFKKRTNMTPSEFRDQFQVYPKM